MVGWTYYDDDYFPRSEGGDEVFDAVVEAVREGGYLFGGDSHQEMSGCCPVLNDGTKACFSWRGWGAVIAKAYDRRGANGRLDHLSGYMDEMIAESAIRRPEQFVDYSAITDNTSKTYTLRLPSSQGVGCFKTYDVRIDDETVKDINRYDYIDFLDVNIPADNEFGCCYAEFSRVREVLRAPSFEDMLDDRLFDAYFCDAEGAGYDDIKDRNSLLKALYNDYPREEVRKHGVVCFFLHSLRDNKHQY